MKVFYLTIAVIAFIALVCLIVLSIVALMTLHETGELKWHLEKDAERRRIKKYGRELWFKRNFNIRNGRTPGITD